MLKTVKGKVIAGTVAVTLLAGTGAAFGAATDVGVNLKAWFDGQFKDSSDEITENVANDVKGKVGGLLTEYNGLKTGATDSINDTKDAESAEKSGDISKKADSYIFAVNAEKAHIDSYLAGEFDELRGFADGLINQAGTKAINYTNNDLTTHTGTKGSEAITALTTDLEGATETAATELTNAIAAAKSSLQSQLDAETEETTDEIIALIDAKIAELRTTITQKRDDLVLVQQGLITAKATELELAAIGELDSIVADINK